MANQQHVDILHQGVTAWNKWRANNPAVVPDLDGLSLINVNLVRINFEDAILSNSTINHSDLLDANFKNAKLYDSTFDNTYLRSAKFQNASLSNATFRNVKLYFAHFENAFLANSVFYNSKLQSANFKNADLSEVSIIETNLSDANFEKTNVSGIVYDRWNIYKGIRLEGSYGSQRFIRHAKDQDFIEEFRGYSGEMRFWKWNWRFWQRKWWTTKRIIKAPLRFWIIYLPWLISCDCGRHIWPWALWSALISGLFGIVYANYSAPSWAPEWLQMILVAMAPKIKLPEYQSAFTPYYFSIVVFSTLGFGDIYPLNLSGQILVIIEVILGYIMLGGLISIFSNKIARRS